MDVFDEDILRVWRLLGKYDVKYIMVGSFAMSLHGFSKIAPQVDIWIKDTLENRKGLILVLKELGLGDFESIETTQFIPGFSTILLSSGFELDIMTSLKGFEQESFDACYSVSPTAMILEVPVKFMHINQLIEAKRAADRLQDRVDVLELEKIRESKKGK